MVPSVGLQVVIVVFPDHTQLPFLGQQRPQMHLTGQILALDSSIFKTQKNVELVWRLPNYCNATLQRNNEIKLTMMKQRIGLESQIVRANGNLNLNHGGSIPCQASCNTDGCKFYVRVVIESEV